MVKRVDTVGNPGYHRSPDARLLNEGGAVEGRNPHLLTLLATVLEGLAAKCGVEAHCNTIRIDEPMAPRADFTPQQHEELAYYNAQYQRHGLYEQASEESHAVVMRAHTRYESQAAALGVALGQVALATELRCTVNNLEFGLEGRDAEMVERGLKQLGRKLDSLDLPPKHAANAAAHWQAAQQHVSGARSR